MQAMTQLAHDFLKPILHSQAICVDGTLGRGRDTLFFIEQNVGRVFYYEIQSDLFEQFQNKLNQQIALKSQKVPHVIGYCHSHDRIEHDLSAYQGQIDAMIFNYGFDPKTLSGIATQANSSLRAREQSVRLLRKKGRIAFVFYPHPEGQQEKEVLMDWLQEQTNLHVLEMRHPFKSNSPSLVCLEKISNE